MGNMDISYISLFFIYFFLYERAYVFILLNFRSFENTIVWWMMCIFQIYPYHFPSIMLKFAAEKYFHIFAFECVSRKPFNL